MIGSHLHRLVTQLNGFVDTLHNLVEACGEGGAEIQGPPPPSPGNGQSHMEQVSSHESDNKHLRLCKPRGSSQTWYMT